MKIKDGFILRKIANTDVVIPVGNNIADFNGVISLNETSAYLWRQLRVDIEIPRLVEALIEEYNISKEKAQEDIEHFISLLQQENILENCI